jgi:hypothetical protein
MNTNLIHNILNIVIDPILAGKIIAGLGTAKMIINVIRDGFMGLTKPQPPVQ